MRFITGQLTHTAAKEEGDRFEWLRQKISGLPERSPIITGAGIALLIGLALVLVGGWYWAAQAAQVPPAPNPASHQIVGLSQTVESNKLNTTLEKITNQSATLSINGQAQAISPSTIRSWLIVTNDIKESVAHIRVNAKAMTESLNAMVKQHVKAPVNQVVVTRTDGSSEVIVSGRNGTQLVDPGAIPQQVKQTAKTVMDAKGLAYSSEIAPLEFRSVTPAAFNKMIEVDVVSKQMYLYENGRLLRSYPISAGAAETPTPIGQFKIYAKLTKQDMRGDNTDGSRYFQPNVRWINYFLPGGYAIHGNYWRPVSVFGAVNTSHGCVSLPEAQAKQVYDWAPIGTTVITHT